VDGSASGLCPLANFGNVHLPYEPGYVISRVGNLTEENSEILKYNLAT
jgi:hypothetical protein